MENRFAQLSSGWRTRIIPIVGDGNCFFRAVSRFLFRTQSHYRNIREIILRKTLRNLGIFRRMRETLGNDLHPIDILNRDGEYADIGVLFLCAHLFGIRINLFRENNLVEPFMTFNTYDHVIPEFDDCLNLYFSGPETGGHFDLLNFGRPC